MKLLAGRQQPNHQQLRNQHQCSCYIAAAVVRKQNVTMDEMQSMVGMQLLEVLLILTRSHTNRQRLLSLGLLPALGHALKVSSKA